MIKLYYIKPYLKNYPMLSRSGLSYLESRKIAKKLERQGFAVYIEEVTDA